MSDDYAIQVSFKTPTQTLINLRAADEPELDDLLSILGRQLKAVGEVELVLAAMQNIYAGMSPLEKVKLDAEAAASRPAQQARSSAPATSQSAPSGDVPICEHGPMQFRKGVTKTGRNAGKPWSGFMCSGPQGGPQCSPQFDKVARDSA